MIVVVTSTHSAVSLQCHLTLATLMQVTDQAITKKELNTLYVMTVLTYIVSQKIVSIGFRLRLWHFGLMELIF